jgi:hypothetical protein
MSEMSEIIKGYIWQGERRRNDNHAVVFLRVSWTRA